ncbi:hypothetical protein [Pseudomonas sp. EA_65y_Pfl2_P78]|uniref:hypothetical protein n=1 Tax=Pseudomonas sp. EA_65y_Pfl2_P78 TaxID=3088695 RepID=UPI00403F7DC1
MQLRVAFAQGLENSGYRPFFGVMLLIAVERGFARTDQRSEVEQHAPRIIDDCKGLWR